MPAKVQKKFVSLQRNNIKRYEKTYFDSHCLRDSDMYKFSTGISRSHEGDAG
jgi:hypothetical protein